MLTITIQPTEVTVGEATAQVDLTRVPQALAEFWNALYAPPETRGAMYARLTPEFLAQVGQVLFDSILPLGSDARLAYDLQRGDPVLLRVHPTLHLWPWELLHDHDEFLAQDGGLARLTLTDTARPLPAGPPRGLPQLHVLLAAPVLDPDLKPDDERQPEPFAVAEEATVFMGLADGWHVVLRPHATEEDVEDALEQAHVFHFVGHGGPGGILLEGAYATTRHRDERWLQRRLRRAPHLLMAVFQSCLTAHPNREWRAVISPFTEAGIPIVMGMMHSITVRAAHIFFEKFYQALAEGESLGRAVTLARRRLARAYESDPWDPKRHDPLPAGFAWEWATPVLYVCDERAWEHAFVTSPGERGRVDVRALPLPPRMRRPHLFVDRRREITEILRNLDPGRPASRQVVALVGDGGIGKTALALEVIYRAAAHFYRRSAPPRLAWITVRSTRPPAAVEEVQDIAPRAEDITTALRALAHQLDLSLTDAVDENDLVTTLLKHLEQGPPTILVLDNLESLQWRANGEIRLPETLVNLLKGLPPHVRALVTSRHRPGVDEHEVPVRALPLRDAARLFYQDLVLRRVKGTPEDAAALLAAVRGNPLAMRLAVAQVARGRYTSLAEAADALRRAGPRDLFAYLFDTSLNLARPEARRAFLALGLFAEPVTDDIWQRVLAEWMSPDAFAQARAELLDLHLVDAVEEDGVRAYDLTPLARAEARRRLAEHPDRDALLRAALDWMLDYVREHAGGLDTVRQLEGRRELGRLLESGDAEAREVVERLPADVRRHLLEADEATWQEEIARLAQQAVAALDARRATLLHLLDLAHDAAADRFFDLVVAGEDYLIRTTRWDDLARWQEQALRLAEARGDERLIADRALAWGRTLALLHRDEEALRAYERSLTLYRALGDRLGEANTLKAIGDVLRFRDKYDEALAHYGQALELFRQMGDRLGEANIYGAMSRLALQQGDDEKAQHLLQKAVEQHAALGSQYDVAVDLGNFGLVLRSLGRTEEARSYLLQAAQIFDEVGLPQLAAQMRQAAGEAIPIHPAVVRLAPLLLGVVGVARGDVDASMARQVRQAVEQLRQHKDWQALAAALLRLLEGERDLQTLQAHLDEIDQQALVLVLAALQDEQALQFLAVLAHQAASN